MPVSKFLGETIHIVRGDGERIALDECVIMPRGSSIVEGQGGTYLTEELQILTAAVVDRHLVVHDAQLDVRGEKFKVDGAPFEYTSFFGTGNGGTLVNVVKTEGAWDETPTDPDGATYAANESGLLVDMAGRELVDTSGMPYKMEQTGKFWVDVDGYLVLEDMETRATDTDGNFLREESGDVVREEPPADESPRDYFSKGGSNTLYDAGGSPVMQSSGMPCNMATAADYWIGSDKYLYLEPELNTRAKASNGRFVKISFGEANLVRT